MSSFFVSVHLQKKDYLCPKLVTYKVSAYSYDAGSY